MCHRETPVLGSQTATVHEVSPHSSSQHQQNNGAGKSAWNLVNDSTIPLPGRQGYKILTCSKNRLVSMKIYAKYKAQQKTMVKHTEITRVFNLNSLSFAEDTHWSTAVAFMVELHIFTILGNHALRFLLQFSI